MKTTIVPAQVTTVEDKIAGSLGFTQLLLMTTPVFLDAALFVIFPPVFKLSGFKLVLGTVLLLVCLVLAIRIRGKLLLTWVLIVGRYNQRPRYYLFNKNDPFLRYTPEPDKDKETAVQPAAEAPAPLGHAFTPALEHVRLRQSISDPRANFHIKYEKGGLRVYIQEIKEESI